MFPSLVPANTLLAALTLCGLVYPHEHPAPSLLTPPLEAASDGVVIRHLSYDCSDQPFGSWQINYVPTDRCLTTPTFSIEIKIAAVCANGTRARWARFSDEECGHGAISPTYGLVDLADADVGRCLVLGSSRDGPKVKSMAFWCDGVKESLSADEDQAESRDDARISAPGNVSESICMPDGPELFYYPETDLCIDLKGAKMKIYSAGVCTNGTVSTLALYEERACNGPPAEFRDVEEAHSESCMDLAGFSSFAFYCTGRGIGSIPLERPSDPCRLVQTEGIMRNLALAGLGNLQHCLQPDEPV